MPPGSNTCYQKIYSFRKIFYYFFSRSFYMYINVCRVIKLLWHPCIWCCCNKFCCLCYSSFHPQFSCSQFKTCSINTHQFSALNTHTFRHYQNYFVSFYSSYHGQSYSCIARCWFYYSGVFIYKTFLFCIFNHRQCNPVFNTSTWICLFKFCVDMNVIRV